MKILLCLQFNNKSAWGGRSFPQPRNVPAKNRVLFRPAQKLPYWVQQASCAYCLPVPLGCREKQRRAGPDVPHIHLDRGGRKERNSTCNSQNDYSDQPLFWAKCRKKNCLSILLSPCCPVLLRAIWGSHSKTWSRSLETHGKEIM